MNLRVDWSVYDVLRRHIVYKTSTMGYTERLLPDLEGLSLMFNDAFEMAAHNLGADPVFFDLVVSGVMPSESGVSAQQAKWESRPRKFDPLERVAIKAQPLSRQPFAKTAEHGRKTAVMIQKFGHGSGFFISDQGHILTNAHVVGDGRRIRVVSADKKYAATAEILRLDRVRDVALLKLEDLPKGLSIVTLPIRTDWPGVGEDVYTIGAPMDSRVLRDTVTKGIVSAHRKNMKLDGPRQNFIQMDATVHAGNSGGPVLDEDGNIVGMTVAGLSLPESNGAGIGLNYFIPIAEALEALNIEIKYD